MNTIMSDVNTQGSANAGSQIDPAEKAPTAAGESNNQGGETKVTEEMYRELEKRFGEQGNELGDYRNFFKEISPLLDKLNDAPKLVQAIIEGRVSEDVLSKIESGEISKQVAEEVVSATEEVKKDVGDKQFDGLSKEEAAKLIEDKVKEVRAEFEEKSELKEFEEKTQNFINSTPDFSEYAGEIDKWLDKNNVQDIEVAYWAVKGQLSAKEAAKKASEEEAEAKKEAALNASGSQSARTGRVVDEDFVDSIISGTKNPNEF